MKKFLTFGLAMTVAMGALTGCGGGAEDSAADRKSTRLNSSHAT